MFILFPQILLLIQLLPSTQASNHARPVPRSLDTILMRSPSSSPPIFSAELSSDSTSPNEPFLRHLDLRSYQSDAVSAPPGTSPHLRHLDLRQVAVAAPAAVAPAAPVVGVGGGANPAPVQPAAGAAVNSVTTEMVATVVGGVTKTVAKVYTQTFAAAGAGGTAPAVQTGTIGLGTLTGVVGVVKTNQAKNDAGSAYEANPGIARGWGVAVLMGAWILVMGFGGGIMAVQI